MPRQANELPRRCARFAELAIAAPLALSLLSGAGCATYFGPPIPVYSPPSIPFVSPYSVVQPNPALFAVPDKDLLWNTIVDVVDDYFKIDREQRVRQVGDVLTEGLLETRPKPGATFFEIFERDSVTFYDRLESTLQSIHRRAVVRVVPSGGGFLVDIAVFKDLESLPKPELGFIGRFNLRNDDSLRRLSSPVGGDEPPEGWILLGRDVGLEQRMMAELQARLAQGGMPSF